MSELPQDIIERYKIRISTFECDGKESILYGIESNGSYIGVINPTIKSNEFRYELKTSGSSVVLFKNVTSIHVSCY
jgi:hypothetical protein